MRVLSHCAGRSKVRWDLSEHCSGGDVVVFEMTGVTCGSEEVVVWEVFEVSGVHVLLELAGGESAVYGGRLYRKHEIAHCSSTPSLS